MATLAEQLKQKYEKSGSLGKKLPDTPAAPKQDLRKELEGQYTEPKPEVGVPQGTIPAGEVAGGWEVPTDEDMQPGIFQRIMDAVGDTAPAATYLTAKLMGAPVDMAAAQAKQAPKTSGDAMSLTTVDRGTMGVVDQLAAGQNQVVALLEGKTFGEAADIAQTTKDKVNNNLAEARNNYPAASLVGDVTGAIVSGIPLTAAFNALPVVGQSVFLTTALAAGTEAGVYTLNSDGTLKDAAVNAGTSAVLGGVGAKLFQAGGGIFRAIAGRSNKEFNQKIGSEIFRAMEAKVAQQGDTLTVEKAARMIDEMGADQVISDLYPDLLPRVKELSTANTPEARNKMLNLLRARNDVTFKYRDEVLKVATGGDMRTPLNFNKAMTDLQAELRPKYDAVFDAMDASQWRMDVKTAKDSLGKLIDPLSPVAKGDQAFINRVLTPNVKVKKGQPPVMSARAVSDAKKAINEEIRSRIANNNNPNVTVKLPIGNLQKANEYLTGMLSQNSEYATLNATYGDLAAAKNAYEYGKNILNRTNLDGADAEAFLSGDRSDLVVRSFAEGSRYGLYSKVKTASDPADAFKDGRMDDLSAILGEDVVTKMRKSVETLVGKEGTKRAIAEGAGAAEDSTQTGMRTQTLLDILTSSKMVTGESRGVGPAFAGRRVLQRAFGSDPTPYPGELARAEKLAATAFTGKDGAKRAVEAYGGASDPAIAEYLGTGVGGYAGANLAQSEAVAATGEAMGSGYDAILEFLNGGPPPIQ
jgi:hypothetical protein